MIGMYMTYTIMSTLDLLGIHDGGQPLALIFGCGVLSLLFADYSSLALLLRNGTVKTSIVCIVTHCGSIVAQSGKLIWLLCNATSHVEGGEVIGIVCNVAFLLSMLYVKGVIIHFLWIVMNRLDCGNIQLVRGVGPPATQGRTSLLGMAAANIFGSPNVTEPATAIIAVHNPFRSNDTVNDLAAVESDNPFRNSNHLR